MTDLREFLQLTDRAAPRPLLSNRERYRHPTGDYSGSSFGDGSPRCGRPGALSYFIVDRKDMTGQTRDQLEATLYQ